MLNRTLLVACLLAALAACERAEEAPAGGATMQDPVRSSDKQAISAMPEHFDRVRAEQYEKEEDRLRRRGSRN